MRDFALRHLIDTYGQHTGLELMTTSNSVVTIEIIKLFIT
jgi:hypothetical protein